MCWPIVGDGQIAQQGASVAIQDMTGTNGIPANGLATGNNNALDGFGMAQLGNMSSDPMLDNLAREVSNSPRDRLSKIVELDPDRAVEVLKQWLSEPMEKSA